MADDICFRFDTIPARDGQTDGQTPRDSKDVLSKASHVKVFTILIQFTHKCLFYLSVPKYISYVPKTSCTQMDIYMYQLPKYT